MERNEDEHSVQYLGDGVYATYNGYGVWLRCNGSDNDRDNIYLEPEVLTVLNLFYKRVSKRGEFK